MTSSSATSRVDEWPAESTAADPSSNGCGTSYECKLGAKGDTKGTTAKGVASAVGANWCFATKGEDLGKGIDTKGAAAKGDAKGAVWKRGAKGAAGKGAAAKGDAKNASCKGDVRGPAGKGPAAEGAVQGAAGKGAARGGAGRGAAAQGDAKGACRKGDAKGAAGKGAAAKGDVEGAAGTSSVHDLVRSLAAPVKEHLWRDARNLGKRFNSSLAPFRFIPRGGLSSPYVQHVSDIDLIFAHDSNTGMGIATADFQRLHALAQQTFAGRFVMSMQVCSGGNELFDREVDADEDVEQLWTEVLQNCLPSERPDVVVLSGPYRWRRYLLPLDLTLNHGTKDMSSEMRAAKFVHNLEEGDFAKAVQRARSALKSKDHKWALASAWNERGGRLRFLVKQLSLLKRMVEAGRGGTVISNIEVGKYCQETLGMRPAQMSRAMQGDGRETAQTLEVLQQLIDRATTEMQSAGASVLNEFCQLLSRQTGVSVADYLV